MTLRRCRAAAVRSVIVLTLLLPHSIIVRPRWGVPLVEGLPYWELDSGGPAVRAHGLPVHPDFAFPQQLNPELAPADWRPRFVDYLYLGFTSATAFSPTDAMPLRPWNKLAMIAQSAISLSLLGLVIARAVNVFK